MKREIKELAKASLRKAFEAGQRLGVNILPHHFYSEIPNIEELRNDSGWKRPRDVSAIAGASDVDAQLELVRQWCPAEVIAEAQRQDVYAAACARNGEPGFGPIEAQVLYAFVRSAQPARIVQVGCGVSTALILNAAKDVNAVEGNDYRPEIICVEPYPSDFLRRANGAGEIKLRIERAQDADAAVLTGLGEDGFLFIDSTHTVTPGSEVNRLIIDILPQLSPTTWVHFHDIGFPYDYSREILRSDMFFHRETVLLHAFLSCNPRFHLNASLSLLHYERSDGLREVLPSYTPAGNDEGLVTTPGDYPSSVYLRVVG